MHVELQSRKGAEGRNPFSLLLLQGKCSGSGGDSGKVVRIRIGKRGISKGMLGLQWWSTYVRGSKVFLEAQRVEINISGIDPVKEDIIDSLPH